MTVFATDRTPQGHRAENLPIANVMAFFADTKPRSTPKKSLPLYSFATFLGDERSEENLERAYALNFDVDEAPTPTEAALRGALSGLESIFTTSSRSTPDAPRWHLHVMLSRGVTALEYRKLWSFVEAQLPFKVGAAAKDPCRGWYAPREPDEGDYVLVHVPGVPFNVESNLTKAALAPPPPARAIVASRATVPSGPGYDGSTKEGARRMALGRAIVATQPPGRSRAICKDGECPGDLRLLALCGDLTIGLELSDAASLEVLNAPIAGRAGSYLEICDPPWSAEHEVLHKIKESRKNPKGRPPGEMATTAADDMARASAAAQADPASPDAAHGYTHVPGYNVAASEMTELCLTKRISILSRSPAWEGVFRWDQFRMRLVAVNPPVRLDAEDAGKGLSDNDVTSIQTWFEANGHRAGQDVAIRKSVMAAAYLRTFHPVKDYLEKCRGARVPGILDHLAARLFASDEPIANTFMRRFMISAVRRIYKPGVKVDTAPVLVGPQGALKSTFVNALFGDEFSRSQLEALDKKDASQGLCGFWAVELGEIDRILRTEMSTVKEFLSRTYDDYRPPYGKSQERFPRECVFIGTTNEEELLRDATGDRRLWPIAVKQVDLAYLIANRDAIWGEALALAESEEPHWLTAEEEIAANVVREAFQLNEPNREAIEGYVTGKPFVTVDQVYYEAMMCRPRGDAPPPKRADQMQITATLKRLGCVKARRGHENTRGWEVPDHLANRVPSEGEARRRADYARRTAGMLTMFDLSAEPRRATP